MGLTVIPKRATTLVDLGGTYGGIKTTKPCTHRAWGIFRDCPGTMTRYRTEEGWKVVNHWICQRNFNHVEHRG